MTDLAGTLVSLVVAVAAGLVGCFAVMRRMALAGDAVSHVALPGIGIAIALGVHPLFGALAMLLLGALLIWALERRTQAAHRERRREHDPDDGLRRDPAWTWCASTSTS